MRALACGFLAVTCLSISLVIHATEGRPNVESYFLDLHSSLQRDQSRDDDRFLIVDKPNGYIDADYEEVALYLCADRSPLLVINSKVSDMPRLDAYRLAGKKWEEVTSQVFPDEIVSEEYIVRQFQAKGVPFTVDTFTEFAARPVRFALPRKGKTIVYYGSRRVSGEEPLDLPLFSLVFQDCKFRLKED